MEYVRDRLVRETIRFLEVCQLYYFNGKISLNDYRNMTEAKKKFIYDVMENEKSALFQGKEIKAKLEKLHCNDNFIDGFYGEVVGK